MADMEVATAASEASDCDVATPTTTISTISLKSGDTRLVIALLQSRDYLQLKVLEVKPELTQLGASLQEAQQLQRAHDDVLQQLQSKQSPVEELLRQADQLISTQKPRAEVYAAMAESLGLAWQDVNAHLEQRKHLLDLNVTYQSRAEECDERMRALHLACRPDAPPCDVDAVKRLLTQLHDLKRSSLEALMMALQDGKVLLDTLRAVAAEGSLDSRPERNKHADYAVSQVELWLEELHDRRRVLELSWQSRKSLLEQSLALSLLANDLNELDIHVTARRDALLDSVDQLGESATSCELLLQQHRQLYPTARDMQDRGLKITRATEQIVASGRHLAGADDATAKAYGVLKSCAEYLDAIEQREHMLDRTLKFFRLAHTSLTKLDQLEAQLRNADTTTSLAQLHSYASRALHDIADEPIQEGHSLLEAVGRGAPGTEGVRRTVQELENRQINLEGLCTAHKEESIRISQALTNFMEQQNELFSWLISVADAFLQGHQDMGSVLPMAEDFLNLHLQLLKELQKKGAEINVLLLTLPPILESLNDDQRRDVDDKVDNLHSNWLNLKNVLEARIDLATEYVKFHQGAVELANAFDDVEEVVRAAGDIDDERMTRVEQTWLQVQQLYVQLANQGKNFVEETTQITDPHLDVKRAALCVETLLEHFGGRRLIVETSFTSWQTSVTHEREYKLIWQRNVTESRRTVDWVSKLDNQLYPILTGDPQSPSKTVARELEDKLHVALPEVKRALTEIELRLRTAETLALRGESLGQNKDLEEKLADLHARLQDIFTEYQILVQMLIGFFKNLADLEKTIDVLQSQYRLTNLPHSVSEIELVLKEHEASRQAILELFKFTHNEVEQIVDRIRQQEPPDCAARDIERLARTLELKRNVWEAAWMDRKTQLEEHRQLCHFDADLHQIDATLGDLGRQLGGLRGQYGDSLVAAQATSQAFVYFEKTIELLETRIHTFVSTAESMLSAEHASSPHIRRELAQLQARWEALRVQVTESRRLIDLSAEYFTLIEEAEEWFRQGSKLLVTIARKSTTVRKPEEATQLLEEVEKFLKPGEVDQDERIKKISRLAEELYGESRTRQVTVVLTENREMIESFTVISEELTVLTRNLSAAEMQREHQKKEQEEQDASLAAARAEAAAAKAAAAASEEARKAAEAAARALREAVPPVLKTVDVGVEAMPPPPAEEPKKKSPTPPPKIEVKVDDVPKPVAPMFIIPLHDSNIQEGERFTFECSVTGAPTPDVIWYKDGMSIQNNPDYLTVHVEGRCSLTIEEVFTEDSARFTCTAGNIAGIAETSATLSVTEAAPDEVLTAPIFTRHLRPSTAKEGSSYQLACKVEGVPLPNVQWYKNGVCVDASPDYAITYNNGDAVLRFEEVFLEDQAEYSCKAINQQGTATTTANLVVEPLEPTLAPSFATPLSNVMARAGQKIKLECDVTGVPTPVLTWSHNGKHIKEARDVKVHYENQTASLLIAEAFPNDAGAYTLTARNLAGEASCTCNVAVKGRLQTETSDSELASDMEPVKPAISLQLKSASVFEGARVQLDCVIVGQPEPEVIWYHDNRPVKESPEFKLLFQGDRCSLVIQEVFLEDAGDYKVTAINSAGEASSTCHLTVTSVSATEPPTRHPAQDVAPQVVGSAPTFTQLLNDVLAAEGDKVLFECCVDGDPRPDIRWYLNNREIQPKDKVEFGEDAEGTMSLAILQVLPEHKGVYTVKASNVHGEAKCFAHLIVKPALDDVYKRHEELTAPPSFTELFADRNVYENEATKFECIVVGKPTPKIQWCFNDAPVSGEGFLVSTSGERQVLAITQVTPARVGKISCVAENDVGKASCVAVLKIMTDNVLDPSTTAVETSSVTEQIGSSSFTMKRSVFVQSSSSHVTSSSTATEAAPSVETHSYARQAEELVKQEGQKPPLKIEAHKSWESHVVDKETPVERRDSFVKVTNGEEILKATSSPVTSPKSLRKTVAPRFMTPLNGKIVDQGADVVFEAIIDGFPAPEVTWTKNGSDLPVDDTRLSVTWALNKARMELLTATVQDAGRYTCRAVNEVGSASSTADLVVKKTVFPPVFGRRLQAQMVKVGERVNMEVEVTGTPEPTVTWYKDGRQIMGMIPGSKFRTKAQGNCYSLVIEEATLDLSGKYMVRAVNCGGEAQSIADFLVFEPQPMTAHEVVQHLVFEDVVNRTTQKVDEQKAAEPAIIPNTFSLAKRVSPSLMSETVHFEESTTTEKHTIFTMGKSTTPEIPLPAVQPVKDVPRPIVEPVKPEPVIFEPVKPEPVKFEPVKQEPVKFEPFKPEPVIKEVPVQMEVKTEPEIKTDDEEVGVQSASISKQTAFDFFVNKMQENKPEPPAESFNHRREPSLFGNLDLHSSRPQYGSPVYALQPAQIGSMNFPPESPLVDVMSQSVHSTSSSLEEFLLQPEPPPEMGFSPKTDTPAHHRDVTSRVKRLEESARVLSPVEIPMGAVRIFPIKLEPFKQEPKPVEQVLYDAREVREEFCVKEEVCEVKNYTTGSDGTLPQEVILPPWQSDPVLSKPPMEEMRSVPWVSPQERQYHTLPIMRPQAGLDPRPTSPRPSAEAVSMEKLWASRRTPEPELVAPFEPIMRPAEIERPVTPVPRVQHFNSESVWSSTQTSSEQYASFTSSSHSEDIKRTASPRPSAEGVSMEKLWTPHKPAEPEVIIRPVPVGQLADKDKPSEEGLKMDKIWAHKHKDSGLKKSWPPQETTESKPIIPWSAKSPEKAWPPVETKVQLSQKEVIEIKQVIPSREPPSRPPPIQQVKPIEEVLLDFRSFETKESSSKSSSNLPSRPPPIQQVKPVEEVLLDFRSFETKESSSFSQSSVFQAPEVRPVQHYVSDTRVSHTSSMPQPDLMSTSTTTTEFKETKSNFEKTEIQTNVVEEDRNWKPSEAKMNWPPNRKDEFELKAPPQVRDVLPVRESPSRALPEQEELFLEPGSPPEFGIARAPLERRLSYKETFEQELEKDLSKESFRVPFGSVRIIPPASKERTQPPPLPPKDKPVVPPPLPAKAPLVEIKPILKKEIKPIETKFERFPDLEPFPYKPDQSRPKSALGPPPPKPSKFHKGEFGASDYDSDMDSSIIHPKWRPYESDTEDLGYRKVRPPSFTPHRPQSTEPEPLPPSKFDNPPQFDGPPRPAIAPVPVKKEKTTSKVEVKTKKHHHHHHHHHQEEKRKVSPPDLRPGSPPEFVQAPSPPKPDPVKVIVKAQESGYMADTEEPRLLMKQSSTKTSRHEETSVKSSIEHFTRITEKYSQESSSAQSTLERIQKPMPQPIYQAQHTRQEQQKTASSMKVLTPSPIPSKFEDRPSSLEPFPYSPEPAQHPFKRPLGPPPASPSKFLKGDFKESDYESDYDSRIPPRWRPDTSDTDGAAFKPVRPLLTPSQASRTSGRTPTPPMEFDDPPQFGGPPRPKFTPIERQPAVKLQEILKPASKPQPVFKPKPVTAKNIQPMDVIIATPAVKEVLNIKPGSPPQLGFAPKRTTTTVNSSPYHNATQTETSNVVNFAESTEHSHRVVSVQQTTRIIKFGDKENRPEASPKLEPFPYKPGPDGPKRSSGPPPTTPKKFVPGEFRESDYESDVEGVHFKPKWVPGDGGVEDLRYRKVQPPTRPASVPVRSTTRVPTPMEFDTQPPLLPTTDIKTRAEAEAEQKRLRRVEDMRKRFGENTQEVALKPGSPPEIAYAAGRIPQAASYAASQQMSQMTSEFKSKAQQFVHDIITDVEASRKPEKPILKPASAKPKSGADEPQAYREESRLAEYGTKHIDPDTGLIYFKYDFGYEFGIVLPGEGSAKKDSTSKRPRVDDSRRDAVDFPVIHEKTNKNGVVEEIRYRPKKFSHYKSVKWEPASESEMSENEEAMQHKKRYSLPQPSSGMSEPHIFIPGGMSPVSLSPSLPSLSPYCSSVGHGPESAGGSPWSGVSPSKGASSKGRGSTPTPPSTPSTPRSTSGIVTGPNQPLLSKKPPTFITPLRDIAVVCGQSARFECIVQAEPPPNVLWSSNGRLIDNSNDFLVEFRNGVCRLTIPRAFTDFAGTYTCTATNMLGTVGTSATLQVPGERRYGRI